MRKGTCKHFNGFGNKLCDAGVCYEALPPDGDTFGLAVRLPCNGRLHAKIESRTDLTPVDCPKFEEPTDKEISSYEKGMEATMKRMSDALPWSKEMRAVAVKDTHHVGICPICEGRIHYSVASVNNHMTVACETDDCLEWRE